MKVNEAPGDRKTIMDLSRDGATGGVVHSIKASLSTDLQYVLDCFDKASFIFYYVKRHARYLKHN